MAITGKFYSARGEELPEGYANIAFMHLTPRSAQGFVYIFRDGTAEGRVKTESTIPFAFEPDLSEGAPNVFAQAYTLLKTAELQVRPGQTERLFIDAQDVFEEPAE